MSVFSKIYEKTIQDIETSEGIKNIQTDYFVITTFLNSVLASFSWENAPEQYKNNKDYINKCFMYSSKVGFFKVGDRAEIAPLTNSGTIKENGLYTKYTAIMQNGKSYELKEENVCICQSNSVGIPLYTLVAVMADKASLALRAVDMALTRAGLPSIKAIQDETKIGAIIKKIEDAYNNKNPFAIVGGDYADNTVTSIDMFDNRQVAISDIWDVFVHYKNLFASTFGFKNIDVLKNERLNTAESGVNDEITRYTLLNDMYNHFQAWTNDIKEKFGYELKVYINRDNSTVKDITTPFTNGPTTEGNGNENI